MAIKHRGITFEGYNKPRRAEAGAKKKFVVAAKKGDAVRLVRFGDPDMTIKKNQPKRKASYWSRKKWDC